MHKAKLSHQLNYCVNPECLVRENLHGEMQCQSCGTSLLIENRYRLLFPLRSVESHASTEVFEVLDELDQARPRKILKALKTKDPKWLELFEREVLVLQSFDHPGLPKSDIDGYFSVPVSSGNQIACLILEKVPGMNLDDWAKIHGKLSQDLALNWLEQLIEILAQLHQTGFFHRDIKPSNIIIRPDGQLVLIDFGAVRQITDTYLMKVSGDDTGRNLDVTVVSTACYAPLEQINGKAVPQSDFYAIGRTLVQLITGVPLIKLPEDPQDGRLLWRHKAPHIAKPVADYLDELMALVPGKRPQSTEIILQNLKGRLPLALRLDKLLRSTVFRIGVSLSVIGGLIGLYQGCMTLAARYFFDRGSEYQVNNELPLARINYEKALSINPSNPVTHNNLALVCQDVGDIPCALAHYKQAFKLNPSYWAAYYNLGNLYDDRENFAEASKQYNIVISGQSGLSVDAANNLSRIKNRQGKYEEAAALAKQNLVRTNDPESLAALYKNLAWAEFGQRRYLTAANYLRNSLDLNPERADSYCLLAQVKEAQGDKSSAINSWENCIKYDSSLPEVREWRNKVFQRLQSDRQ